jgi:hypothetical protein
MRVQAGKSSVEIQVSEVGEGSDRVVSELRRLVALSAERPLLPKFAFESWAVGEAKT